MVFLWKVKISDLFTSGLKTFRRFLQFTFIKKTSFITRSEHGKVYFLILFFIALFAAVAVILGFLEPIDAHSITLNRGTFNNVKLGEKWKIPVDEKHSYPQHRNRIKRSKKEDNCRQKVDNKFIDFTRTLRATGSKYQELFKNIGSLKCIYVSGEAYLGPYQTSKMEHFAKIGNSF